MTVTAKPGVDEKPPGFRLLGCPGLSCLRPKGLALVCALSLVGMMAPTAAMAGEATLGGVSVTLPPSAGFCDMSANHLADSRAIASLSQILERTGGKLLSETADCSQLADWRVGRRKLLDDYAQYQTRVALLDKPASGLLAQTCNTLRVLGNSMLAKEWPNLKARIESALQNVKADKPTDLGVLDEDANGCYGGLIQKMRTEAGTDKTVAGLGAITVVRNRLLYLWRYTVYHDPDTVDALLAKVKLDVAALIAANP